jgi:hypothetical protein
LPPETAPPVQLGDAFTVAEEHTGWLMSVPPREGDPRFLALLDDIEKLHAVKQRDYGRDADPFANVRASEEWGVSPWIGALIRATDKVRRLQTYAIKGSLSNEGVEDSLMDLAVYSLIALILFREEQCDTGAERYLARRLEDPEYRAAYEAARKEQPD